MEIKRTIMAANEGPESSRRLREALGFLVHNVVIHPLAGLLWFAADLGAGEWVGALGDLLHGRRT